MPGATIFDIKRFAVHDGPGIRTTVFFKGCPLRCWWCHNPESQASEPVSVDMERKVDGRSVYARKTYGEKIGSDKLMEVILRNRHYYEESGGGVTFSGGEPLMQPEALTELLQECKRAGLHTTVDTCGFSERVHFEKILPLTDLFLYDLKNMDPDLHRKYTGVDNELILSNADYLLEEDARVIFRIPVIPGINTSEEEISRMILFLVKRSNRFREVHLLPYHPIAGNKYSSLGMRNRLPDLKQPDTEMMDTLKKRFERTGLEILVGG
ncbi:MAG: glycyl-radical enzyme activating protein [Bacteroidales bacterium]